MAQQKGPESIDDGQTHESGVTPRTGVRNLAGCAVLFVVFVVVALACVLIVFAPRGGSDAAVAEPTRETAETEIGNMPLDEEAENAGPAEESENVALAPEVQPTPDLAEESFVPGGDAFSDGPASEDSPVDMIYLQAAEAIGTEINGVMFLTEAGCFRVVTAANGENPPWVSGYCVSRDGVAATTVDTLQTWGLQMDAPTEFIWANNDTVAHTYVFTIGVDEQAYADCDCNPYSQAHGGSLIGWTITGNLGDVAVNGGESYELNGAGVYQMNLPEHMDGVYNVEIIVQPGGFINLRQGAMQTTTPNWPIP